MSKKHQKRVEKLLCIPQKQRRASRKVGETLGNGEESPTFGEEPPIDRYIDHPVFRFISVKSATGHNISIYASVNTDDQGVFDTSLGNEYALLACALSLEKDDVGHPQYSDDEIYDYLERLQKNGKTQVFPKAELVGNGGMNGSLPKHFMNIDTPYTLLRLDK